MFPGGGPSGTAGGLGAALRKTDAAAAFIATGATIASFDTVDRDTGGFYSALAPTKLTAPSAGWYLVQATLLIDDATLGLGGYGVKIQRNGGGAGVSDLIASNLSGAATAALGDFGVSACGVAFLQAGDYVESSVLNASATAGNLVAGSRLSILRLG